jgi:hypothetical protein
MAENPPTLHVVEIDGQSTMNMNIDIFIAERGAGGGGLWTRKLMRIHRYVRHVGFYIFDTNMIDLSKKI